MYSLATRVHTKHSLHGGPGRTRGLTRPIDIFGPGCRELQIFRSLSSGLCLKN